MGKGFCCIQNGSQGVWCEGTLLFKQLTPKYLWQLLYRFPIFNLKEWELLPFILISIFYSDLKSRTGSFLCVPVKDVQLLFNIWRKLLCKSGEDRYNTVIYEYRPTYRVYQDDLLYLCVFVSQCLCLWASVFVCVCVFVSQCMCLWASVYVCESCVCVCEPRVCVCEPMCVFVSQCMCLWASVCVFVSQCVCLWASVYVCEPVCVFVRVL